MYTTRRESAQIPENRKDAASEANVFELMKQMKKRRRDFVGKFKFEFA